MKRRGRVILVFIIILLVIMFATLYFLNFGGMNSMELQILAMDLDRLFFEVIVNDSHSDIISVRQMLWERERGNSVNEVVVLERGAAEGPPVRRIILVHSYEEALQYSNTRTLAVWPSAETARALAAVNLMYDDAVNGRLRHYDPLILEALTFPITTETVVTQWEDVRAFIMFHYRAFGSSIQGAAHAIGAGWEEGGEAREHAIALGVWPLETEE